MDQEPRPPVSRGQRSAQREMELVTRDRLTRVLGLLVGVGATAWFVSHRWGRRGTFRFLPALDEASPVAAWCVLALSALAFTAVALRVPRDDFRQRWLLLLVVTFATTWLLRLVFTT